MSRLMFIILCLCAFLANLGPQMASLGGTATGIGKASEIAETADQLADDNDGDDNECLEKFPQLTVKSACLAPVYSEPSPLFTGGEGSKRPRPAFKNALLRPPAV